jgi:hypothetical protein
VKTWSRKRKLFLIDLVTFQIALVVGLVFLALGSAHYGRELTVAIALAAICAFQLTLRLTYFKGIQSQIAEERRNRR